MLSSKDIKLIMHPDIPSGSTKLCPNGPYLRPFGVCVDPLLPGGIDPHGPSLPPEAAKQAMRDQLLAAAGRAMVHGIRLVTQASTIATRMTIIRGPPRPMLPAPDRASPCMFVQLRLLDGQVFTQMVVSLQLPQFSRQACRQQQTSRIAIGPMLPTLSRRNHSCVRNCVFGRPGLHSNVNEPFLLTSIAFMQQK